MNTDSRPQRPEPTLSTSAGTIRGLHMPALNFTDVTEPSTSSGHLHSPQPSAPPSPTDSVSSFPSVSSSFFISSGPASPPPSHPDTDPEDLHDPHNSESTSALIIPSLTLPSALRRPTVYGQVLGELRVFVLGRHGVKKSRIAEMLLEGNEDLVDVDEAEEEDVGPEKIRTKVWRASTDWVEHRDAHGLEKIEPRRNVEVIMWPGYDPDTKDPAAITAPILKYLHTPFHHLHAVIDLSVPNASTTLLTNLVSAPSTPLWTLAVLVTDKDGTLTALDRDILSTLSPHIPFVVLPAPPAPSAYPIQTPSFHDTHVAEPSRHHSYSYSPRPRPASRSRTETVTLPNYQRVNSDKSRTNKLSVFRPAHVFALRTGLFRSPETLALLRNEAGERWVRWRRGRGRKEGWDKRRWEEELIQAQRPVYEKDRDRCAEAMGVGMDPLHFPSLWAMALGVFTTRTRVKGEGQEGQPGENGRRAAWRWVILAAAAFCAGVGVGWGIVRVSL
ncbi:hypothetical protein NEOLEDRAFT_1177946 [Neolentinus lepideus HHB14362 ss-1]|uniref:Septin-type G domain-containing protein n=1 Tax=Neolentinus lepideus HHB14362 ss-1 TaxID=1314782 RepID=A0A165T589_9AGAM|nr:hypothetical protein NEOLEDRAFT_1177946 [Neolentinus lepideus HHB14362 ss-1]